MSLIRSVTFRVGRDYSIEIPDKPCLRLRGQYANMLLCVIESLLANDFTGYYYRLDQLMGIDYGDFPERAILRFGNAEIVGNKLNISTKGNIPNMHCIRGIQNNVRFRSFLLKDSENIAENTNLGVNMAKYSTVLDDVQWIKFSDKVNNLFGFTFMKVEGRNIQLNVKDDFELSKEMQKFVYTLLAECYLTPKGYSRIMLLSNMSGITPSFRVRLLECLAKGIKGGMILTTFDIAPSDLNSNVYIGFLNV